MPINTRQRTKIESAIAEALRGKFRIYKPEAAENPFHIRLLGGDRMALFSFIHSLNTTFGTSIFEPVAVALAEGNFAEVARGKTVGNCISADAQSEISQIINQLGIAEIQPDAEREIARIRRVCQSGIASRVKLRKADVWLVDSNGELTMIEMKTAKPNIAGFEDHKRQLLSWIAAVLHQNPCAKVSAKVAIPYNPYAPESYKRWTMRGMYDTRNQLMVAEEFWNFLDGGEVYDDLLSCFERVGIALRKEIDDYFSRF